MRENYRVDKRLYDFSAGCYCGVVMPEHVMRKLAKLNAAYSSEIRKVLDSHKDELYPQSWTLANQMDGDKIAKQITVKYALKNPASYEDVEHRIKLFTAPLPIYVPDFYLVDSREMAQQIADEILAEELAGEGVAS